MILNLRHVSVSACRRRTSRIHVSSHGTICLGRQAVESRRCIHSCSTSGGEESLTKVEKIIRDSIAATGPMSMSTYMQFCLSHPTDGYYMNPNHPVFGPRGDFTTSPEISQVFGELLSVWHLSQIQEANSTRKIRIVELGPGRGTLMQDTLRVFRQFPRYWQMIGSVHLVETSPKMRELQGTAMKEISKDAHWDLHWHDSLEELETGISNDGVYTMLNAHEFFDALPVHLIEKRGDQWHDVLITTAPDPTRPTIVKLPEHLTFEAGVKPPSPSPSPFRFVLSPEPSVTAKLLASSSPRFNKLPSSSRIEASPTSYKIARRIGDLIGNQSAPGGSALIVDYGDDHMFGNSIRAFRGHKLVDVFHQPGQCDLTANVDFAYLKEAMADVATTLGPLLQHDFLQRMGIHIRVEELKRNAIDDARRSVIEGAAKRLVEYTGMGKQYKVLGVIGKPVEKGGQSKDVWPFMPLNIPHQNK